MIDFNDAMKIARQEIANGYIKAVHVDCNHRYGLTIWSESMDGVIMPDPFWKEYDYDDVCRGGNDSLGDLVL